jgi:hypothetical protein
MSIITKADLLASMAMDFRLPWHGMAYVLVVGSRAERVRSQRPIVDLTQLER